MNENSNMENFNNEMVQNNLSEQPIKPKVSKGLIVALILVLLILMGEGAYFLYQKFGNKNTTVNSIQIYESALNSAYTNIENLYNNNFSIDFFNDSFSLEGSFKINTDMPNSELLNGIKLDLMGGFDYKNKTISLKAGLSKNNTNLSALFSIINKKIYLEIQDVFTKPIYLGEQDIFTNIDESLNNMNLTNVLSIETIQKLKDIIINTLDENKFSKTNETINLEGKNYNVTTLKYHMDEENQKRTKSLIKEAIKNDSELNEMFSSDNIQENETGENFDIVVYIHNNKIIGGNIYLIDSQKQVISLTNIDDLLKIKAENENTSLNIEEKNDNYLFSLKDEETELTMNITNNGSGNLSLNDSEVQLSFDYKNMKNNQNEISLDFDLKIIDKLENNNLNLNDAHLKLKKGTFTIINTNDAKDINSLTETELTDALQKMGNILSELGIDVNNYL